MEWTSVPNCFVQRGIPGRSGGRVLARIRMQMCVCVGGHSCNTTHRCSLVGPINSLVLQSALWWNGTSVCHWTLRRRDGCCLHFPQGENFRNRGTTATFQILLSLWLTSGAVYFMARAPAQTCRAGFPQWTAGLQGSMPSQSRVLRRGPLPGKIPL